MLKRIHKFNRHIPRLWKWTGGMAAGLSLLMTGLMLGVRLFDLPGCMVLYPSGLTEGAELDLYSGRYVNAASPRFGVPSQDGNHVIYIAPDDNGLLRILIASEGSEPVVLQEGVANIPNWQWDRHILWSQDGQYIAYLWVAQDGKVYLSIANADGSAIGTAAFPILDDNTTRYGNSSILGWSADKAYLVVATEYYGRTRGTKFTFWSVPDLRPVGGEVESYAFVRGGGGWSPVGHRFAVLSLENNQEPTLFIMTPGAQTRTVAIPDPAVIYFDWSPDGRYLMFAGLKLFQTSRREFVRKWVYHLYSSEGEPLYTSIVAARSGSTDDFQPITLNGLWSSDGDEWWFLQERQADGGAPKVDLAALNLASGLYKLVAVDIPPEFAEAMLITDSDQLFTTTPNSPENPRLSHSPHLLIPSRRGGKMVVDLIETATHERTTLVEGADAIIDTRTNFYELLFWSWDGTGFVIPWSAREKVYLTLMNLDQAAPYTFDDGLQGIGAMRWSYDEWIGYLGRRDSGWSVELIHRRTHEPIRLVDGLDNIGAWEFTARPDFRQAAVMVRENPGSEVSQLYLSPMDAQEAQQIHPRIRNYPLWSPDGTRLAYLTTGERTIDIVTDKGEFLQQVIVPRALGNPAWFGGWTDCE